MINHKPFIQILYLKIFNLCKFGKLRPTLYLNNNSVIDFEKMSSKSKNRLKQNNKVDKAQLT